MSSEFDYLIVVKVDAFEYFEDLGMMDVFEQLNESNNVLCI